MTARKDEQALGALYHAYIDTWNRRDIDGLCALFAFPMVVGGGGRAPVTLSNADAYCRRTQAIMDDISARGWTRSVIDETHAAVTAGGTGVITVRYHRERADGSVIEGGTSNYLTLKVGGEWKMTGMIVP